MSTWQVEYRATYWVEAESEDQALDLAIAEHEKMPDGDWEAFIDSYDSNNYNTLGDK